MDRKHDETGLKMPPTVWVGRGGGGGGSFQMAKSGYCDTIASCRGCMGQKGACVKRGCVHQQGVRGVERAKWGPGRVYKEQRGCEG